MPSTLSAALGDRTDPRVKPSRGARTKATADSSGKYGPRNDTALNLWRRENARKEHSQEWLYYAARSEREEQEHSQEWLCHGGKEWAGGAERSRLRAGAGRERSARKR